MTAQEIDSILRRIAMSRWASLRATPNLFCSSCRQPQTANGTVTPTFASAIVRNAVKEGEKRMAMARMTDQVSKDDGGWVLILAWCDGCAQQVRMVTPKQAAAKACVSPRTIYRWAESEKIHWTQTPGGMLVCLNSLYSAGVGENGIRFLKQQGEGNEKKTFRSNCPSVLAGRHSQCAGSR